jgi:hypothetical protein
MVELRDLKKALQGSARQAIATFAKDDNGKEQEAVTKLLVGAAGHRGYAATVLAWLQREGVETGFKEILVPAMVTAVQLCRCSNLKSLSLAGG